MSTFIHITNSPLDAAAVIALVKSDTAGAVNVFVGTVRNITKNKPVIKLEFEAYEAMALKEMNKIAQQVKERWPINAMAIHHRLGDLSIGDIPVVIAVSTPHRQQSFEACQFAIDELKKTVPIWKKEFFSDGSQWVSAHP